MVLAGHYDYINTLPAFTSMYNRSLIFNNRLKPVERSLVLLEKSCYKSSKFFFSYCWFRWCHTIPSHLVLSCSKNQIKFPTYKINKWTIDLGWVGMKTVNVMTWWQCFTWVLCDSLLEDPEILRRGGTRVLQSSELSWRTQVTNTANCDRVLTLCWDEKKIYRVVLTVR